MRIEIGQRHHGHHFAGFDVEHEPRAADGAETRDRRHQFLAQHMLHADVDRERERTAAALQHFVERLLHAGEAFAVDIGEADHMGGQRALRIDAALVALEINPRDAEPVHVILLARREMAPDPHEGTVARELGLHFRLAQLGQHRDQLAGGFAGVDHMLRIGVERRRGERGRQQFAVAVDDVGAHGRGRAGARRLGDARLVALLQHGDVGEPHADGAEGDGEHESGDQQPGAADLDRLLGGAVETVGMFLAGHQRPSAVSPAAVTGAGSCTARAGPAGVTGASGAMVTAPLAPYWRSASPARRHGRGSAACAAA